MLGDRLGFIELGIGFGLGCVGFFQFGGLCWASAAIQDSIGVPPTEELINPTGTPSSRWSSRPKKYSVAENPATFSGEHIRPRSRCIGRW